MNIKELIKIQNNNYKFGTTKNRCLKLELLNTNRDFLNFLFPLYDHFSKKVFKQLKAKKLIIKSIKSQADHLYENEIELLAEKENIPITTIKRQILRQVLQRYQSYIKRNKKSSSYIKFKNRNDKGLEIYSGCVSIDKEKMLINFKFFFSKDKKNISVPFDIPLGTMMRSKEYLKEEAGGNLTTIDNKLYFVARTKKPVVWKYQPKDFLGFDLNKTPKTFMVFSDMINFKERKIDIISKNDPIMKRICNIENKLRAANKDKTTKWKKIKRYHKKLTRLYDNIVKEITKHIEDNQLCICIDNLKVGKRHGSFGQDKIISKLITICEDKGLPFVLVPTPYTTMLCSNCKHLNEKLSGTRTFECSKCNFIIGRDKNSAINIKERGKRIWEIGLLELNKEFKNLYNENIFKHG